MCRILSYLGNTEPLDNLLYKPDSSLIKQSYDPQLMHHIQNLAGFGMAAWGPDLESDLPYVYKTSGLPFFDKNLHALSAHLKVNCLLAHVRGVLYDVNEIVSEQNVHPFLLGGSQLAFAHNGNLAELNLLKPSLFNAIKPEISSNIKGSTDTEWLCALFLSQFEDCKGEKNVDEVAEALLSMLKKLQEFRHKLNIRELSPLNLFVSNGKFILVTRFVFNFGTYSSRKHEGHLIYHSLWYTFGESYGCYDNEYKMRGSGAPKSFIFASEPLTRDRTTWLEIPEYSLSAAWYEGDHIEFVTRDIDLRE